MPQAYGRPADLEGLLCCLRGQSARLCSGQALIPVTLRPSPVTSEMDENLMELRSLLQQAFSVLEF